MLLFWLGLMVKIFFTVKRINLSAICAMLNVCIPNVCVYNDAVSIQYIMCFFFYILLGHLLAKRIGTFTIQKYLHIHVYENKISEQMQMFINIRKTELKSLENLGFPFCISSNISPKYCFTLSSSVILHMHFFYLLPIKPWLGSERL